MGFLSLFVLFLMGRGSFAQISSDYKKYKEQYPNAQSVRLNQETVLDIGLVDGRFVISQEFTEEDLYLYESARYEAKQSLSYSSFYELEKIEASSFVFKDDTYEELKVSDFKEKDELDDSFYDDIKSVNFIFPGLGKGAKSKLKYKQIIKNPRFLSAFYFGSFYPIANNKFTIVCDKNIHLRFQAMNMEGISVEFMEKTTRKENRYTWHIKNMDEFRYEPKAPDYKGILPHIIPIIVSYEYNGKTVRLLDSVSDLYGWYHSLVAGINQEPAPEELVQLVHGLTADKQTELEKVRAIYYWVQENIKYIAFEYALGGFIPREANEVYQKKYGDCKDNSSLLHKMLDIANIRGNLTWIGTRSIPYRYDEVPTPSVDNHMILHYEYEGESYFLDATGRYTPLELPTSFIQGKEALVGLGPESFAIKEVPVVESSKNQFKDYSVIELEGNDLKGTSKAQLSGYGKVDYFYQLEKIDTKPKLIDLYNHTFEKGNNSFQITNLTEINKYSYDDDLIVEYDFNVSNYAKALGNEVYINLNLDKPLTKLRTDEDRTVPLEHRYLDTVMYQNELVVPEGYVVEYLPKGITLSNEYFDSSISYEIQEDHVVYSHNFRLKRLVFDLNDLRTVNELVKAMEQHYKEVVVLKKE